MSSIGNHNFAASSTPTPAPAPRTPAAPTATPASLRLSKAYATPDHAATDRTDARSPDVLTLSSTVGMPAQARALVAARVQSAAEPTPTIAAHPTSPFAPTSPASAAALTPQGALSFYRHPADRNAVATRIATGAALDVRG